MLPLPPSSNCLAGHGHTLSLAHININRAHTYVKHPNSPTNECTITINATKTPIETELCTPHKKNKKNRVTPSPPGEGGCEIHSLQVTKELLQSYHFLAIAIDGRPIALTEDCRIALSLSPLV